jgi:uncharacterized membrane protein YdjX (TVP38/TMEM64 family)
MNNWRWKRIINLRKKFNIKIFLVSSTLLWIAYYFTFHHELLDTILAGDIDKIRKMLMRYQGYVYLIMLAVMVLQNTFTIIPLILVITINITLFGFINGFLWSWITSIIASLLVFICVRYVFQDWVIRKFHPKTIAKVEQDGFMYVFQGRIFPFIPTSAVNIVAGLSSIETKQFMLGTIVGNFIYFFVLALIPAGLLSPVVNEYLLGMSIFLLISVFFGLKKFNKRKRDHSELNISTVDRQEDK